MSQEDSVHRNILGNFWALPVNLLHRVGQQQHLPCNQLVFTMTGTPGKTGQGKGIAVLVL